MTTKLSYLAFILEQLSSLSGITHRKMMGEFILYHHGKIAAYLCDDRLLVKILPSTLALLRTTRQALSGYVQKRLTHLCVSPSSS